MSVRPVEQGIPERPHASGPCRPIREVVPMIPLRLFPSAFAILLLATVVACSRPRLVRPQATPSDSPPVAAEPARDDLAGRADLPDERALATSGGSRDSGGAIPQTRIYFHFDP